MDFEKLGVFYLGKEYDVDSNELQDRLLLYDARDLTTHAVCVGMTGSGKTGLCIDLLEEAAIDHVPAIIIDPKGDITNLLLTFPELRSEDFRPWVNADDARRKDLTEDEFAAQEAELWRKGLTEWGQSSTRILLLREAADFAIYTPGSDAGIPVSILRSFAAPKLSWQDDAELLRELIQGTVTALLGLVGVDADPVKSREHILLSNLFEHYWRQGEDLDLPKLILSIQEPPLQQLGVFDVDTFFPEKDRFKLAMAINNLIAAPGFRSWLQGQPLNVAGFLATPSGKPRHSIFYIAHLSDAERMFFVSMLLNQIITWMRALPGTTSLRALLYMDEIFGFFPPIANPPTKQPMLTLLKQARAFGLGIVLTTQNPVDLDYKGLANAGTWFIGRLRTERDKSRLLDGLESASSSAGQTLNREALSNVISNLDKRVFLLHSIYEEAPVAFKTRWAMSYLRGPLTRTQIRTLMKDRTPEQPISTPLIKAAVAASKPAAADLAPETFSPSEDEPLLEELAEPALEPAGEEISPPVAEPVIAAFDQPAVEPTTAPEHPPAISEPSSPSSTLRTSSTGEPSQLLMVSPPPVPSRVEEVYLPTREPVEIALRQVQSKEGSQIEVQGHKLIYVPGLLGMGQLDFVDRKKNVQEQERFALLAPAGGIGRAVWERAKPVELSVQELADRPEPQSHFVKLPDTMDESTEFTTLRKSLEDFLYYNWHVSVFHSPALDIYSGPDEGLRDFKMRLQQAARERRDEEVDKITERYESKLDKLWDRLQRAEAKLERKEADADARKREAMVSIGESVLSMFGGRRSSRSVSTYLSKRRMASMKEMEVEELGESVEMLEEDIAQLEEELELEVQEIQARWEKALEELEEVPIRPRRTDVQVELFALAWTPYWGITYRKGNNPIRTKLIPAI
jgi:hypothetical protein